MVGTFIETSGAVFVLENERRERVSIDHPAITRLERAAGRKPATARGALIGAVTGAAAFGALAAMMDRCDVTCISFGDYIAAFAIVTGAGAGAGYIVGRSFRIDEWQQIPVPVPR